MQSHPYAQILQWAEQYASLGADRLLLGRNDVPQSLRRYVAEQIALIPNLKSKLPSYWAKGIYIARGINLEQCTSEACAHFKATLTAGYRQRVMDLTGGLGIDFLSLSAGAERAVYVERDEEAYRAAEFNLPRLHTAQGLYLYTGDSMQMLPHLLAEHRPTLLYVDPARRADADPHKRVYGIEDCSPNVIELLDLLGQTPAEQRPDRVLVKLSPMLDLRHTLSKVSGVIEVHIIAYRGEVKELLLTIAPADQTLPDLESIPISAVNLHPSAEPQAFSATLSQEAQAELHYTSSLKGYLYEPNAAVMKSGLFASLAQAYELEGLHPNSHLFTSDALLREFPGRCFLLEEVIPYQSSIIKQLRKRIPEAMIATRNFPLRPEELRRRLGIRDAGVRFLLGTTLCDGTLVLLLCRQVDKP